MPRKKIDSSNTKESQCNFYNLKSTRSKVCQTVGLGQDFVDFKPVFPEGTSRNNFKTTSTQCNFLPFNPKISRESQVNIIELSPPKTSQTQTEVIGSLIIESSQCELSDLSNSDISKEKNIISEKALSNKCVGDLGGFVKRKFNVEGDSDISSPDLKRKKCLPQDVLSEVEREIKNLEIGLFLKTNGKLVTVLLNSCQIFF